MTEDLKAEQCVIKRCKIEQITIKANEQKKSNNDPIIYKKYNILLIRVKLGFHHSSCSAVVDLLTNNPTGP